MFFFAQLHGFARKAKHGFGVLTFRGVVRRFVAVQNLAHPDRLTREREDLFFFFFLLGLLHLLGLRLLFNRFEFRLRHLHRTTGKCEHLHFR